MRTPRTGTAALVLALAVGLGACGGDSDDDDDANGTTTTTSSADVVFDVELDGDAEAPGPGSAAGSGTARVTVDPDGTEVCYELTVDGLDTVTGAHIHEGREGTAGPIAVSLDAPTEGSSEGCVETSTSVVGGLANGSRSFYVNIHTTEFPDGAVRAQLTG